MPNRRSRRWHKKKRCDRPVAPLFSRSGVESQKKYRSVPHHRRDKLDCFLFTVLLMQKRAQALQRIAKPIGGHSRKCLEQPPAGMLGAEQPLPFRLE